MHSLKIALCIASSYQLYGHSNKKYLGLQIRELILLVCLLDCIK